MVHRHYNSAGTAGGSPRGTGQIKLSAHGLTRVEKLTSGSAYEPLIKISRDYIYGKSDPAKVAEILAKVPKDLR